MNIDKSATPTGESPEYVTPTFHHILRVYLPFGDATARIDDVLEYCRRTGCQELLLFTSSYDQEPSFQTIDSIEQYVRQLEMAAERLRRHGITVSINVMQTLGHIYYPKDLEESFPFRRRVYADGRTSTEGACPLCDNLAEWVAATYTLYARLKPRVLFVDDDFRTAMQGLSCFCEEHLLRISEMVGHKITRQEVVSAVESEQYPSPQLRRAYWEVTTEGFSRLAARIRYAVHSSSPETLIGAMTSNWPLGCIGMDWKRILKCLCGDNRPMMRPQVPMYSEAFLRDMPEAFSNPGLMRSALGPQVEYWPEVENYQYGSHSKSAQANFAQISSLLFQGFNHMAISITDFFPTPFSDHEQLIALLEEKRPFFELLRGLIPEGVSPIGIRLSTHPIREAYRHRGNPPLSPLLRTLQNLGLPTTHSQTSPWSIVTARDAMALSDQELDSALRNGALLDVEAAALLCRRGFSDRLGISIGERIPLDDLGYEEFGLPEFNPLFHNRKFPLRALVDEGDWRQILPIKESAKAASVIRNYKQELVGPAILLTENEKAERFATLAWSGRGSRNLVENRMRAEQLREIFNWITRTPCPCVDAHAVPYLWPIVTRLENGDHLMGLINLSTDTYEEIPVLWPRTLPSNVLSLVDHSGKLTSINSQSLDFGQYSRIVMRCKLAPLGVAAILFAK